MRKKVGKDYPVIYRLSADELVEGGLTIEDSKKEAKLFEEAGIDALDVSIGVYETLAYSTPTIDLPPGFNVDNAASIKSVVSIPIIATGRINDPILAEKIIDDGKADFVNVGRGQIADPEFVNKAIKNDIDGIVKCLGCMQGCSDMAFYSKPISCLRNPAAGQEAEYELEPAKNIKNILVVGGGPGGIEAARTLKERGHNVTLCEKTSSLGGQFFIAGIPPRKQEFSDAALQMGRMATREGVNIKLQTEVTPELIETIMPDVVIIATGSTPFIPNIPGIENDNVATAIDVLTGNKTVKQKVVILGGGLLTANKLLQ